MQYWQESDSIKENLNMSKQTMLEWRFLLQTLAFIGVSYRMIYTVEYVGVTVVRARFEFYACQHSVKRACSKIGKT